MMLTDQIFAQAALLAGQLEERQVQLLRLLCQAAEASLGHRLREGITAEDCKAEFVAAASLLALAALTEAGMTLGVEEFRAGDLTIRRRGGDPSSRCLQRQAELIIGPFLRDSLFFQGV